MKLFSVYCILLLASSCMSPTAKYDFIDGSGNRYVISPTSMEYIPVEPETSSSGFYSGGKAKSVPLSETQFSNIQNLLEKALAEPGIHAKDRVMMSGVIEKTSQEEKHSVIIQPGTAELKAITQALEELKK